MAKISQINPAPINKILDLWKEFP